MKFIQKVDTTRCKKTDQKYLKIIELVLALMDAGISAGHCAGMLGMINEAFLGIQDNIGSDAGLRDLCIAYYLQQIESVEMSSFQVMEMASVKLKDKQIKEVAEGKL